MYLVSYTAPPECGVYALTIALEGKRHIYNSPFSVFVSHGPVHVDHCSILGRALVKGGKNLPMRFHIHTADKLGNSLTLGGCTFMVSIHELLRPGQDYEAAQRIPKTGDSESEEEEEKYSVHEVSSPKTGQILDVPGFENEIARVGKPVASKVWDHKNGSYTCEFSPSRVGRLQIEVEMILANGDRSPLRESPFYPLVSALPEWNAEEVGVFIERIGFPELSRVFVVRGVDGMRLCALTDMLMESELAITNKSMQRTLLYLIEQEMKVTVVLEAVNQVDDLSLAQMGIYVYMYIYMYIYVYMYMNIYVNIYLYTRIYICISAEQCAVM